MSATGQSAAAMKAWATRRDRTKNPPPAKKKIRLKKLEPIKLPKNPTLVSPDEIMARTVVMILTLHGIGNRRKVDTSNIEVAPEVNGKKRTKENEVDKEWLHLTKRLIEADELDEITSRYGEMRRYVESLALPSQIKRGVYIMPTAFVKEVDAKLKEGIAACQPFIKSLGKRYDSIKAESQKRLGPLFNDDDFMTKEQLIAAFRVTWRFVYVDSAPNLEGVSKEVYDEERRKAQQDWLELGQVHRQLLRGHMSEFVNHLIDRFAPDQDGRCKMFREGSIEKFQRFCETFSPRNIGNDLQMQVLVDRAKDMLKDVNADTIRTDDSLRAHLHLGFENIKAALDTMVVTQPKRAIHFE